MQSSMHETNDVKLDDDDALSGYTAPVGFESSPPNGIALNMDDDSSPTKPSGEDASPEDLDNSLQYYQQRRTGRTNSPRQANLPDSNRKRCYVDPYEPFPQATYYLNRNLKRPTYEIARKATYQDSSQMRHRLSKLTTNLNQSLQFHSKKMHMRNNKGGAKQVRNDQTPVDAELVSDSEHDNDAEQDANMNVNETNFDFDNDDDSGSSKRKKFGAWDGVFVSCLLNIFGVIMFLRMGFIVGQCGLLYTILIILLSTGVTTLTTLSMAAIATNGEQGAGGAYYMISRTLGPAIGASVGVMFSIGMSVATSLYVIGLIETIIDQAGGTVTGSPINDIRLWGSLLLTLVFVFCTLRGIGFIIKAQLILVTILVIAILAFMIGTFFDYSDDNGNANSGSGYRLYGINGWYNGNLWDNMGPSFTRVGDGIDYNLFLCFGIYFPAATGIMAGANISGDLKNPSKDIPLGTLNAVFVSSLVYCITAILFAVAVSRDGLIFDYLIILDVSVYSPLILCGIYAATLSSALSSMVGAPRVLVSIADDDLMPILKFFAKLNNRGEPIRAYVATYIIALACVLEGNINFISPLITEIFLATYAAISFACFFMSISHSPGWRPAFGWYSKYTSFSGGLLCIIIMGLINLAYAVFAFIIGGLIFVYVTYAKPEVNWGNAFETRAKWKANQAVLQLNEYRLSNVVNFQPSFLVLCKTPKPPVIAGNKEDNNEVVDWEDSNYARSESIINFVRTLRRGFGAIVYCHVVLGNLDDLFNYVSDPRKKYYLEFNKVRQLNNNNSSMQLQQGSDNVFETPLENENETNKTGLLAGKLGSFNFSSGANWINMKKNTFESKLANDLLKPAFYEEIVSNNVRNGARIFMQTCGIGKLRTNTVVVGFKENWAKSKDEDEKTQGQSSIQNYNKFDSEVEDRLTNEDYVGLLMDSLKMRMGFMVCRGFEKIEWHRKDEKNRQARKVPAIDDEWDAEDAWMQETQQVTESLESKESKATVIDVWWLLDDGGLSLLIPHLVSLSSFWKKLNGKRKACYIRLFLVAEEDISSNSNNNNNNAGTPNSPSDSDSDDDDDDEDEDEDDDGVTRSPSDSHTNDDDKDATSLGPLESNGSDDMKASGANSDASSGAVGAAIAAGNGVKGNSSASSAQSLDELIRSDAQTSGNGTSSMMSKFGGKKFRKHGKKKYKKAKRSSTSMAEINEIERISKGGLLDEALLDTIDDTTKLWKEELKVLIKKFRLLNILGIYTVQSGRTKPKQETLVEFCQMSGVDLKTILKYDRDENKSSSNNNNKHDKKNKNSLNAKGKEEADEQMKGSSGDEIELGNAMNGMNGVHGLNGMDDDDEEENGTSFHEIDILKRWLRVSELINAYSRKQKCVFITAPFPQCFKNPKMYLGVLDMLSKNNSSATVMIRGTGDNVLTFYSE